MTDIIEGHFDLARDDILEVIPYINWNTMSSAVKKMHFRYKSLRINHDDSTPMYMPDVDSWDALQLSMYVDLWEPYLIKGK